MIRLENVSWSAGSFRLDNVSFEVPAGAYAVLMGRTGCGKTSIVEIICGLRDLHGGRVWIGEQDVTDEPPGKRGVGYVPQDGALFPTMTVREQIGFAPALRKTPVDEIKSIVESLAGELGIDHLLDRLPADLSGGEKQRVAVGRALAARPKVMLLDEPLSALDEDTRDEMAALLKRIQTEHRVAAIHITHSRQEAAQLADIVFRLENGKAEKVELNSLQAK